MRYRRKPKLLDYGWKPKHNIRRNLKPLKKRKKTFGASRDWSGSIFPDGLEQAICVYSWRGANSNRDLISCLLLGWSRLGWVPLCYVSGLKSHLLPCTFSLRFCQVSLSKIKNYLLIRHILFYKHHRVSADGCWTESAETVMWISSVGSCFR